jgi:hypothetical protein
MNAPMLAASKNASLLVSMVPQINVSYKGTLKDLQRRLARAIPPDRLASDSKPRELKDCDR